MQPEERPTDPHYRRALLDREWLVPGHSHGKAGAEAFDPTSQSLRQLAQASEGRPSRLRGADQSPDRHEAQQPEMREVGQGRKLRLQRLGQEARFRLVTIHVDLEVDAKPARAVGTTVPSTRLAGQTIETSRQIDRIDRLDGVE